MEGNNHRLQALYKIQGDRHSVQEKLRKEILQKQKKKRSLQQDAGRSLETSTHNSEKPPIRCLQMSEWMREKPTDMHDWILVPCPKGQRCLIVARKGRTYMYGKGGHFIKSFKSTLPGDGILRNQITVLDCIFDYNQKIMYILDALVLCYQDLVNCEAAFRFFWLRSRINELNVDTVSEHNEYKFIALDCYEFEEEDSIIECFSKCPQFHSVNTPLDGFLFYHREASYTYGTTPLVGWLFAFMIKDVLGYNVHPFYLEKTPENYVNHLHYITLFEEARTRIRHNSIDGNEDPSMDTNN